MPTPDIREAGEGFKEGGDSKLVSVRKHDDGYTITIQRGPSASDWLVYELTAKEYQILKASMGRLP